MRIVRCEQGKENAAGPRRPNVRGPTPQSLATGVALGVGFDADFSHAHIPLHSCSYCAKTFASAEYLTQHCHRRHSAQLAQQAHVDATKARAETLRAEALQGLQSPAATAASRSSDKRDVPS